MSPISQSAAARPLGNFQFVGAKLLQTPEGKVELKGATKNEQTAADECIFLFMHKAVVGFPE